MSSHVFLDLTKWGIRFIVAYIRDTHVIAIDASLGPVHAEIDVLLPVPNA